MADASTNPDPAPLDLSTINALTFDVGGTVFDWHHTIRDAVDRVARGKGVTVEAAALANSWRQRTLELVGQVRSGVLPFQNIDDLHRRALDTALQGSALSGLSSSERNELTWAWHALRAWPDAAAAIARLRQRFTVVVLSILSFSLLVDSSKFAGITWDGIISCEFIRYYKDDARAYATGVRWLGLEPAQVMMVAAHPWDLDGARRAGLHTAYVPRAGEWGEPEQRNLTPAPFIDIAATDFEDLVGKLGA